MKDSNLPNKEVNDVEFIEDMNQLQKIALGAGAVTCQICDNKIAEGRRVVVYAYRPADAPVYRFGHILCTDHAHQHPDEYTLGVRELVVTGRVGRCLDHATQSTWPILLAPELVAASPEDTSEGTTYVDFSGPDEPTDSDSDADDDDDPTPSNFDAETPNKPAPSWTDCAGDDL